MQPGIIMPMVQYPAASALAVVKAVLCAHAADPAALMQLQGQAISPRVNNNQLYTVLWHAQQLLAALLQHHRRTYASCSQPAAHDPRCRYHLLHSTALLLEKPHDQHADNLRISKTLLPDLST